MEKLAIGFLTTAMITAFAFNASALAATARATVNSIDAHGVGAEIGTVVFEDTEDGLLVTPDLSALSPGVHGFHVHQKGDCGPGEKNGKRVAGLAAGGHYDPQHTGKHLGPYRAGGHKGDLPTLVVAADGRATLPLLAPHLTVEDIRGRSIVVHAKGDNYSDDPAPLGGGGARVACGLVK